MGSGHHVFPLLGRGLTRLAIWLAGPVLALAAPAAAAHEYWIAPESFTAQPGARVEARLMVGEMLKGNELPWLSHQVARFLVAGPEQVRRLEGTEGDLPAASFVAEAAGLYVIAHETHPLTARFDFAAFREYLDYEGLGHVAAAHRARGLPEDEVPEAYARAAKALVQVGSADAGGSDRPLGLAYELVALANPYAGGDVLPVRLLWQGRPAAGAPVAVIRRRGEAVDRLMLITDAEGRVEVPLMRDAQHLLNAVHIVPVEGEAHVWASTWASLSFAVPPGP